MDLPPSYSSTDGNRATGHTNNTSSTGSFGLSPQEDNYSQYSATDKALLGFDDAPTSDAHSPSGSSDSTNDKKKQESAASQHHGSAVPPRHGSSSSSSSLPSTSTPGGGGGGGGGFTPEIPKYATRASFFNNIRTKSIVDRQSRLYHRVAQNFQTLLTLWENNEPAATCKEALKVALSECTTQLATLDNLDKELLQTATTDLELIVEIFKRRVEENFVGHPELPAFINTSFLPNLKNLFSSGGRRTPTKGSNASGTTPDDLRLSVMRRKNTMRSGPSADSMSNVSSTSGVSNDSSVRPAPASSADEQAHHHTAVAIPETSAARDGHVAFSFDTSDINSAKSDDRAPSAPQSPTETASLSSATVPRWVPSRDAIGPDHDQEPNPAAALALLESNPIPHVNVKVSCRDIRFNVQIPDPQSTRFQRKTITKPILKGISVVVEAGTVLAILGPSGSGKTTFLDILAGRKTAGDISGEVLINDEPRSNLGGLFTRIAGYVTQDDVLPDTLTVRESLWYTAQLRLPQQISEIVKNKRVDDIINSMGLTGCQDSRIGGQLLRGISGGERRRVSIGTELLTSPSILFLDEPTSGLSATDALNIMRTIIDLSKEGRAIITTIHQPRSNIFQMFDQLLLMSSGSPVYYGPASAATQYFGALGFPCPSGYNVADFILDLVTVNPATPPSPKRGSFASDVVSHRAATREVSTFSSAPLKGSFAFSDASSIATMDYNDSTLFTSSADTVSKLIDAYQNSPQHVATKRALDIAANNIADGASISSNNQRASLRKIESIYGGAYATSFMRQLVLLSRRMFFTTMRNPFMFAAGFVINIVFGVITGSLWSSISQEKERSIVMVLYYIPVFLGVESFLVAPLLVQERHLFLRERSAGAYRTSSYLVAKVLNETPQYAFSGLVFALICYFMIGLTTNLFFYCMIIIIFINVGISFVSLVGAASSTAEGANMGAASFNTFAMLFAGCFQTLPNLPSYWKWAYYVSYMSAGFSGLVKSEFSDAAANGTLSQQTNYLILQTYDLVNYNMWDSVWILFIWWVGFRGLTYFALRFLNKEQR